jgi:hypothetical protein
MDLHAEEGSEALVVDAKTDRVAGAEEDGQARGPRVRSGAVELEAVSTQRYGLQRLVYALAALREGAAAVEVVHVFLERPGEPTSVRYVAGDRDELERRLLALAEELMEGRYVPSGAPNRVLCASCPGRAALCAWGPERTRAEPPGVGLTGGEGDPPPPLAGSAGAAEDGARRSVGTTP